VVQFDLGRSVARRSPRSVRHNLINLFGQPANLTCLQLRAPVTSPWLLLLDEPSLGLPSLFVQDIFTATRELCQLGLTISLVDQVAK
jgi:hypothetical protein